MSTLTLRGGFSSSKVLTHIPLPNRGPEQSKLELIPIDEPEVLSDLIFFKDLFEEAPKLKLQHEFSELANLRDHAAFLKCGLDHAKHG